MTTAHHNCTLDTCERCRHNVADVQKLWPYLSFNDRLAYALALSHLFGGSWLNAADALSGLWSQQPPDPGGRVVGAMFHTDGSVSPVFARELLLPAPSGWDGGAPPYGIPGVTRPVDARGES